MVLDHNNNVLIFKEIGCASGPRDYANTGALAGDQQKTKSGPEIQADDRAVFQLNLCTARSRSDSSPVMVNSACTCSAVRADAQSKASVEEASGWLPMGSKIYQVKAPWKCGSPQPL